MRQLIEKIFLRPTTNTWLQLFRYGFVGGAAFLVDYGTLFVCTEFLGIHHLISAALAFILGLIANYLLSVSWVFVEHSRKSRLTEFAIFCAIGIIGLGLNEIIIYAGTDIMGIHYMVSKLISTGIVFFWNFFARKFACFQAR